MRGRSLQWPVCTLLFLLGMGVLGWWSYTKYMEEQAARAAPAPRAEAVLPPIAQRPAPPPAPSPEREAYRVLPAYFIAGFALVMAALLGTILWLWWSLKDLEGGKRVGEGDTKSSGVREAAMGAPEALKGELLDELVRRIVQAVRPRRIVLFGSAAKGRMGPESDLDVLVVMPDGAHRRRTAQALYRGLMGLGVPKDIVVVTESDVRQYAGEPSLVICPALKEGRELYRAS